MADASTSAAATTAPVPGLINAAPGSTSTTPGTSPTGAPAPGAPVTGYNPSQASTTTAASTNYNPSSFTVTPNQTTAGQISNIIASGSPLMQQAEANANMQMNQRGLINSSQAITAGQSALYSAAEPIAQSDANTYATAATNTTQAQNAAAAANAAATNTAALQNSNLQTQTSQFNAGQGNAALSQEAGASNTVAQQAQQEQSAQTIANTQAQNAIDVQNLQNAGNLANIQANGQINEAVTNLTDQNKTLLQTSSGAASLYSQALQNLSNIITNPNLSDDQKTTALNDGVQQMNDALSVLSTIAGTPDIQSTLTFSDSGAMTIANTSS